MTSISYRVWRTASAAAVDEIARAHSAVGGTARGRQYATQQVNRAYAVLLASHFQRFCRNLHSECVDHLTKVLEPAPLRPLVRAEFTRGRQLDRGNAQPGSVGADFGRLGSDLWAELAAQTPASVDWRADLRLLNEWRNAIAHEDFTAPLLAGQTLLRLAQVRRWRGSCRRLARGLDELMRQRLQSLTGKSPW
jgi:hypothetical protein